jgi:hypothetical protein
METVIQSVLNTYGVYSAALEREWIKAQQRTPPPPERVHPGRDITAGHRETVRTFLSKFPQAWTVEEVSLLTRLSEYQAYNAIRFFLLNGLVSVASENRGRRGHPQRYQWVIQ